jgi:hypothetical protein
MDVKENPQFPLLKELQFQSPNGGVWRLTVNDQGMQVIEKIGSVPAPHPS